MIPLPTTPCKSFIKKLSAYYDEYSDIIPILNQSTLQSLYSNNLYAIDLSTLSCPICGSHDLNLHGYYKRRVCIPSSDPCTIRIARVICPHCKEENKHSEDPIQTTHALLPWWLLPYSPIPVPSLLALLLASTQEVHSIAGQLGLHADSYWYYCEKYKDFKNVISSLEDAMPFFYSFYPLSLSKYLSFSSFTPFLIAPHNDP